MPRPRLPAAYGGRPRLAWRVFPGQQRTTWTRRAQSREVLLPWFYQHQPDLNTRNPAVRAEIQKIMGFWLQLGVSGFRMDAVPFLIEKKGAGVEHVAITTRTFPISAPWPSSQLRAATRPSSRP